MAECRWTDFKGQGIEDDDIAWEEECFHVADHPNPIPKYCPQWRCKFCHYVTGDEVYAECPSPNHILLTLAFKVIKGEPIHVQKSR